MSTKYTEELKQQALNEYYETGKKKATALKYGIPLTTFCHWVNNANAIKLPNAKYEDEFKQKIIQEYVNGENTVTLAKKYNLVEGTVNSWIKPYARKRGLKSKVEHEDYFDHIDTQEKAYFLGWIMADGNVSIYNGQYSLKLHIQLSDRVLIDRFCEAIGCTNAIVEKETLFRPTGKYHKSCYVSITSVHMVKSLMKLGVVPNKTGIERMPNLSEELIPHFIRGFFDGDGIVTCTDKSQFVGVVSNLEMLKDLNKYFKLDNKVCPHKVTPGIGTIGSSSPKKLKPIYDLMYKDATIYLERKHDSFVRVLNGNTEVTN